MPYTLDYIAEPTFVKFHASTARRRGVRGPIGSGKSTACSIEIFRRAQEQVPGQDKKRKTRFAIIRNCYDEQTEVLTERGWRFFRDLGPEDRVATRKDGYLTFERPSYFYSAPYDGEMIGIKSQNADLLVTPDHHLWVSTRRTRKRVWHDHAHVRADAIYGIGELHRMTSVADYALGESALSEDFFEFLGFWFAEGYAGIYPRDGGGRHYRLVVTQKDSGGYVEHLLTANGFKYGRCRKSGGDCFNYTISIATAWVKALIEELSRYGKAKTKWLPDYIKGAPKGHLEAFLRGYQAGDGHFKSGPKDCDRLYTASKRLADDLHELVVKTGRAATVSWSCGLYLITILTKSRSNPVIQRNHWSREAYRGMVYCVEVSTHVIYVRRNGKAVWCGQTYRQLHDTTLKTWLDWFPEAYFGKFNHSMMEHRIKFGDVETEVLFRALDRPEHVANLLSLELTGAWINEARELPFGVVQALDDRIGRFPAVKDGGATWVGMIMDTNPPDTDHWWYRMAEEDRPEGWSFFDQPSGVNEIGGKFVPNAKAENLKNLEKDFYKIRIQGKNKDHIRVYYCNRYGFVKDGKPVYPEYIDEVHCAKQPILVDRKAPLYVGVDFGLTPAALFAQPNVSGRWFWIDELVTEDMGAMKFGKLLATKLRREYAEMDVQIFGDPAGAKRSEADETTPFMVLQAQGIPIVSAPSNDPILRHDAVAQHMKGLAMNGQPAFQVSPACKIARKGLAGGYCLRRIQVVGAERYKDIPEKNRYSHVVEAGEYAMLGAGEGATVIGMDEEDELDDYDLYEGRSAVTGY